MRRTAVFYDEHEAYAEAEHQEATWRFRVSVLPTTVDDGAHEWIVEITDERLREASPHVRAQHYIEDPEPHEDDYGWSRQWDDG
jgi:hypothetical protein